MDIAEDADNGYQIEEDGEGTISWGAITAGAWDGIDEREQPNWRVVHAILTPEHHEEGLQHQTRQTRLRQPPPSQLIFP